MSLDSLINVASTKGYVISSMSRCHGDWSIVLWRSAISMDSAHVVIRNPSLNLALHQAILALDTNTGVIPPIDRSPTYDTDSLNLALSNLLTPQTVALSPPKFKLKTQ